MARYDRDHGYGNDYRQVRREPGFSQRGISPSPHWEPGGTLDPNYRGGEYQGMRMRPGMPGQGAYGWYRASHARDLGADGGWEGRYGERYGHGQGRFDRGGIYREDFERERHQAWQANRDAGSFGGPRDGAMVPRNGWPRYDAEHRGPFDGGVHQDVGHLRQLNANSVAFRHGSAGDRGFGWAEHPQQGGGAGRERGPENRYDGQNAGGYAEMHRPRQASR
jgi:hypothetical protein